MSWNFIGFTKVLEIHFDLHNVKVDIDFYSGNKCINKINSMLNVYVKTIL